MFKVLQIGWKIILLPSSQQSSHVPLCLNTGHTHTHLYMPRHTLSMELLKTLMVNLGFIFTLQSSEFILQFPFTQKTHFEDCKKKKILNVGNSNVLSLPAGEDVVCVSKLYTEWNWILHTSVTSI